MIRRYDMVTNYRCGESIDELERAQDGEWVRWEDVQHLKFPKHIEMTLEHNPHNGVYESVLEFVQRHERDTADAWVSPMEREIALETQELWTLQWYPDTPVGFHYLQASTLEALLAAVKG